MYKKVATVSPRDIRIEDFDYPLPDERIARHPLAERDACRLLVSRPGESPADTVFSSLPELLPAGAMLVCNDTRVINARMEFRKPTGSRIEIFLLEPAVPADYAQMFQATGSCRWSCLVGNVKRWKQGALEKRLNCGGREVTLSATLGQPLPGAAREVSFSWTPADIPFASIVDAAGYIPIPPYLRRESEAADATDYQTVYSRVKGSVAAPTAGLHFTDALFAALRDRGIGARGLTLHVGAGTFQPVKSATIGEHPMHTETFSVERSLVADIIDQKRAGRPIVAVGTTSVRTLETLPVLGHTLRRNPEALHLGQWEAYEPDMDAADTLEGLEALLGYMDARALSRLTASTAIMIAPGFRWRLTDIMVTNFHQPQSTLLLLVSSFLGDTPGDPDARWITAYRHALAGDYRFLSYGDACLLFRADE